VTIVVPVFNRFLEAERAIRSVLAQTWKNWELIVIDDASSIPFTFPEACMAYSQQVMLLRNPANLGPGKSRQRGVDLARGTYLCFLDSDDFYHPDFLALSVQAHSAHPEIAATYTTAKYVQTDTIREGSEKAYSCIMPTLFNESRPWPTCGWVWKRVAIARWKPLRTNQDSLFELDNSFINNTIAHIPQVLCFIDKGTGNNTTDLVAEKDWNRDRNFVARYALQNWRRIQTGENNCPEVLPAIIRRITYVSSKLAAHGDWVLIMGNGIKCMRYNPLVASILILLAPWVILPVPGIRGQVKRVLDRLSTSKLPG